MAETEPKQAWWLDLTITPSETTLDNLPVSDFNKNWKHANYLDTTLLTKYISSTEANELTHSKLKLTLSKDLNNNNLVETIKVGIFKKKNNKKGIFLAIFEDSRLIKVFSDSTNKGFSASIVNNKRIHWYKCIKCGNYETIYWNGKTYVLE